MGVESKVHETLTALADALVAGFAAAEGFDEVEVWSAHPGDDLPPEAVVLLGASGTQAWAALGRGSQSPREEVFAIPGSIWVAKPGANEDVIREARARVDAILDVVFALLRVNPSVTNLVRIASPIEFEMGQGPGSERRWCEWAFVIECKVRV